MLYRFNDPLLHTPEDVVADRTLQMPELLWSRRQRYLAVALLESRWPAGGVDAC